MTRRAALGLFFLAVGAAGALASRRYGLGTGASFGPGLFPAMVAAGLLLLGAALLVGPGRRSEDESGAWSARPCVAVTTSVLTFMLLVERGGLFAAGFATILVAGLGSGRLRVRETLVLGVVLTTAVVVLFVWLLGQPLAIGPGF